MVALVMLIKCLGTFGELMLPYVLEHLIDNVAPRMEVLPVIGWGMGMIGLAIFTRQFNVKANRLAVKVAKSSIYEIRRDLFWKSVNLSGKQFDEFGLPSLTSRMTSDSYNVQNFIQSVQAMGVRAPILLFGGIIITLTMDPGLAAILCIMAPVLIVIVVFVSFKGIPLYDKVQKSVDDIVRIMDFQGNQVGVGKVNCDSKQVQEAIGKHGKKPVVHYDYLYIE